VSTGFYYTLAGPGLTLEQHDQTVHEVLAEIENDTDYLQIEVPARLIGIDNRLLTFSEQVLGVEGAVAAVDAIIRAASANVHSSCERERAPVPRHARRRERRLPGSGRIL
jgi:hypothetical protein